MGKPAPRHAANPARTSQGGIWAFFAPGVPRYYIEKRVKVAAFRASLARFSRRPAVRPSRLEIVNCLRSAAPSAGAQCWPVLSPLGDIAAWPDVHAETAASTLYAARGRPIPLSVNSPTGSTVTASLTAVKTRGLIRICPGLASSPGQTSLSPPD